MARLQQELQSVQNTLADKHDHFALASKAYEQAIQHLLASNNRLCHSITQLQAVMRPSCSPTQSPSDVFLAQTKDVNGLHVNPDSFPYPSVDCIHECRDTPVPNGIQQRLALPRPKSRLQLSLKKDVPSWPDVPRPQPKSRLSLKRASKVPNSPDVCHQDSPVPAIASEDVYHASTCTPTLSDSDLGVSNEVKTCIPSHVASPDLNDTYSSGVGEALSHVKSALSHAYAVLEHSLKCDIKLHPLTKVISTVLPCQLLLPHLKAPLIKWPQFSVEAVLITYVQHCTLARRRNISIVQVTWPLVMRILINLWLVPLSFRVLLTIVPTMLSHLYLLAMHTDHHYCQAKV